MVVFLSYFLLWPYEVPRSACVKDSNLRKPDRSGVTLYVIVEYGDMFRRRFTASIRNGFHLNATTECHGQHMCSRYNIKNTRIHKYTIFLYNTNPLACSHTGTTHYVLSFTCRKFPATVWWVKAIYKDNHPNDLGKVDDIFQCQRYLYLVLWGHSPVLANSSLLRKMQLVDTQWPHD